MKNLNLFTLTLFAFLVAQPAKAQDAAGLANRIAVLVNDFYVAEQLMNANGIDALTVDDFVEERIGGRGAQKTTKSEMLAELHRETLDDFRKVLAKVDVKRSITYVSAKEPGVKVDFK